MHARARDKKNATLSTAAAVCLRVYTVDATPRVRDG